ncbi:hypothetical protein ACO0SA_003163 [Hanseniaspora valbyensis]
MFKNFSQQLGTNLSSLKDELSKQIQEKREDFNELYENSTQQSTSNMTLPEEYKVLPKEVQVKMLKFMKYEEKYPQLLNAYKKFRQDTIDLNNANDELEKKIKEQESYLNVLKEYYIFSSEEDLRDFLVKWTERETLVKEELNLKNKEINELKNRINVLEQEKEEQKEEAVIEESEPKIEEEEEVEEEKEKEKDKEEKVEEETPKQIESAEPAENKENTNPTIQIETVTTTETPKTIVQEEKSVSPITDTPTLSPRISPETRQRSAIQWQIKYNTLDSDHKKLQKDYLEVKDTLKTKVEEINNMKDMLKEVGNQLVDVKEKQKQTSSTKTVEEAKYKTLENNNKQMQARNVSLSLENQKLKTALSEKEDTVKNLELEVKQLNMKHSRLNNKLEELGIEKQQLVTNLEKVSSKLELKIKENGQLEERVSILKEKSLQKENIKTTSTDIVDSLTRQCNELNSKLKEVSNLKNNLEDELSQTNDQLYKQKRDLQILNEQILTDEVEIKKLKQSNSELETKVTVLTAEQSASTDTNSQSLQKTIETKTLENENLEKAMKEKENLIGQLQQQIQILSSKFSDSDKKGLESISPSDTVLLEKTIQNLKMELQSKNKSLNNLELTLQSLRKLNKDLTFKMDKLNKIYQQQRISSSAGSRHSSIPADQAKEEEEEKAKISYIKNVLIGFIEHKEQRQQLLPVISMLLQFTPQDQQKFLMSLK